ncbi:MAG: SCP2 sterol-binding domain-containing protein [Candidatus Competibacterales bacterium]|nr:SCP2 sterol-binding domain-containing protein [Candidatus Competibacterales bacterium]
MIPPAALFATTLETAVNGALRLDPVAAERVAALEGRQIALELTELGLTLHLFPGRAGLRVRTHAETEPDLALAGTLPALLRAATSGRFADDSVTLRGDAQLGRELQAVLTGLDLDWEELLARLIGDLPARQFGRALRAGRDWSAEAAASIERNAGEYLHYETRVLPERQEVEAFLDEVDRLGEALARLEARVRRLRQQLDARR